MPTDPDKSPYRPTPKGSFGLPILKGSNPAGPAYNPSAGSNYGIAPHHNLVNGAPVSGGNSPSGTLPPQGTNFSAPALTTPTTTPTTPSGSNPSSKSNGGLGGSGAPGSSSTSIVDKLYAALMASTKQTGIDNNALVDKSITDVKKNYSDATLDTYRAYQNSRDDLEGRSANLGVDLDASKMGETWDASLRRMQEMSDSNLNSDLSYFEKMRLVKQAALDALMSGIEQDKLARVAAMRSGGGGSGGGGRGGSGGSKSSSSGSATETQTVNNVGDVETYNALKATNPKAAQLYYNHYWSGGANSITATGSLLGAKTSTKQKSFFNPLAVFNNASNGKNYDAAIQAMQGTTGVWGNPKVVQKVSYKGK